MKKGAGKLDAWCTGRQMGIQSLLVVVTLCMVVITVHVPQFFGPNILPQLDSHIDVLEDGLKVLGSGKVVDGLIGRQRKLIANEWDRTHPERLGPSKEEGQRTAPSKARSGAQGKSVQDSNMNRLSLQKRSSSKKQRWDEGSVRNGQEIGRRTSHQEEHVAANRTVELDMSLAKVVERAWLAGSKAWKEVEDAISLEIENLESGAPLAGKILTDPCPASLSVSGKVMDDAGRVVHLPCGLMFGSAISLVGVPRDAHMEYKPPIARFGEGVSQYVMVSQFVLELQGLKVVDDEEPPRILHVNPRLRGDWSWKPVIEHNTCYRGHWGSSHRCEGWLAPEHEETVDGIRKCEKWLRKDDDKPRESKKSWWLDRLMSRSDKETLEWEYPLSEGRLFVLTIRAGLEGFHLTIDGRHISSFPYRTGYVVEEATGISVAGDIDLVSMTVTSLPVTHPSYYSKLVLEDGDTWKAPPLLRGELQLFIGIMSSSNHFSERMAVRRTWLQSQSIRSSQVVARFFVALHTNKNINLQVKKEADYYGDMIILPFIDRYDIVVLKTVAICKFGVQNVTAKYVMKCDDDTFVRVDSVLKEVEATAVQGLYMGSMNEFHRPLRTGKWAVTFEEWPERIYPIYANGPGYVLSKDIVQFIVSQSANGTLRLFKMEDVSVGLWVGQYGREKHVQYENSVRFAQAGCVDHYLTAHYQSPRQMMCLWDRFLATGWGGHTFSPFSISKMEIEGSN